MMKRLSLFLFSAIFSCTVFAQSGPLATPASVEKLLEVTETKKMYEVSMTEMSKMLDATTGQLISNIPPEKHARFRKLISDMDGIIQQELSWDKMKPQYVQIYSEIFSQNEIDDLIAFYETPSGKSFIQKQPLVLERTAVLAQEKMNVMMQRLYSMLQNMMEE